MIVTCCTNYEHCVCVSVCLVRTRRPSRPSDSNNLYFIQYIHMYYSIHPQIERISWENFGLLPNEMWSEFLALSNILNAVEWPGMVQEIEWYNGVICTHIHAWRKSTGDINTYANTHTFQAARTWQTTLEGFRIRKLWMQSISSRNLQICVHVHVSTDDSFVAVNVCMWPLSNERGYDNGGHSTDKFFFDCIVRSTTENGAGDCGPRHKRATQTNVNHKS